MSVVDVTKTYTECDRCGRRDLVTGEGRAAGRERLKREGWHVHDLPAGFHPRLYDHCPACGCPPVGQMAALAREEAS